MSESKKKNRLFNLIAPVYGRFYKTQKEHYTKIINDNKEEFDILSYKSIVDIGCGTGALCSALAKFPIVVTGVEPAKKMLKIGASKPENKAVNFINGNTEDGLIFEDKTFDLSIASYVAHGMHKEERLNLYLEMTRVTKNYVIFHDYNKVRSVWTNIIEWAERGDYFYFIKHVEEELNENFKSVRVINVDKMASWYICEPKE